ncbi:MAG: site-specific integrase [Chthoniobacterales bacterium]
MSDFPLTTKRPALPVPAIVAQGGTETVKRYIDFFGVPIRNPNTRMAYHRAIKQFLHWADQGGFRHLEDIEPIHVAAYIEGHGGSGCWGATEQKTGLSAAKIQKSGQKHCLSCPHREYGASDEQGGAR